MKSAIEFQSALAAEMRKFVELRQLSGSDYQSQTLLLSYFDKFLVKETANKPFISRDVFERYLLTCSHLKDRVRANRISVIRQFCQYVAQSDSRCYVPEATRVRSSNESFCPHIFTKEEITALLNHATQLKPDNSLRPLTNFTLFALLYSTGVRIGEALAFNVEDFYPKEQRLHIRRGKYRKARWVPLSDSISSALQSYIFEREKKALLIVNSPLFMSLKLTRLSHPSVQSVFDTLLKQCKINSSGGKKPRIHDLRHTFAVHRLLQWYRDGSDVNSKLPALATYMGHVSIHSTQVYLHSTPELLEEVNKKFLSHYQLNICNGETL